jgi:pimeloyl-ACP methyl ester carboxylesterase
MIIKSKDGLEIFFTTYGDKGGIPVVLVHGFGADHNMWKPQIEKYPEQEGMFVVAMDVRGHGKSSSVNTFRYEDCASDINLILEQLELEKAYFVGVSMGGNIVQQFACDYHEKVEKLVVVDSFSGSCTAKEKFNAWFASFALNFMPKKLLVKGFELEYKKIGKEAVGKYFKEQLLKMELSQVKHIRDKVNKFNITNRLHEINVPTLVLTGDKFGKWFIDMGKRTAEQITNSRFVVLPGGADPSNLVIPEIFDKEVISFIKNSEV